MAAWATPIVAIVVVWAGLFGPQLFNGQIFSRGDASIFGPFAEFSRERWLKERQRTYWNPYVFVGLPATASLADPRPQYLPDVLLDAYEAPGRWSGWPPLLPVLLAHLIGMFAAGLLARALWNAGPWAFAWAAIAFGLATNVALPVTYGHDAQQVAIALMPLALLGTHLAFASKSLRASRGVPGRSGAGPGGFAGFALLAGALGLQALNGHPQYVAYTGILVLAFGLERAWHFRRLRRWIGVVLACALGALLSSVVWWPAYLYGRESVRSGSWGGVGFHEVKAFSLALRDGLSFVWPWAVGFGEATYWGGLHVAAWPAYLGVTVLALAVYGLIAAGPQRGVAVFWIVAALLGAVLAFGTQLGPFYTFLYERIPLWSLFRVAVGTLVVTHLGLALVSARGVDQLLVHLRSARSPTIRSESRTGARTGLVAAVTGLVVLLVLFVLRLPFVQAPLSRVYAELVRAVRPAMAPDRVADLAFRAIVNAWETLLLLALCVGVIVAAMRFAGTRAWLAPAAGVALLGLLVWDFLPQDVSVARSSTGPPAALAPAPALPIARFAEGDPMARVAHLDKPLFLSNTWVSWRVRSIGGVHGAAPRRWKDLMERGLFGQHAVICAYAVRYVASDTLMFEHPEIFEPIEPGNWRVVRAFPRAYAVPRIEAPGNDVAVLQAMGAPDLDPTRVAFAADDRAAGDYPGSVAMLGTWLTDEPDLLVYEASAPDRAFLVIADAWFPGWKADVDGEPVPIYRVHHMLRGVVVPAGTHRVTMRYEPDGWGTARIATLVGFGLWLLLVLAALIPASGAKRD
ncbi:MAG: hypothetical protein ACREOU_00040 [Candidatus Eiseniibacteriota bacterium]